MHRDQEEMIVLVIRGTSFEVMSREYPVAEKCWVVQIFMQLGQSACEQHIGWKLRLHGKTDFQQFWYQKILTWCFI